MFLNLDPKIRCGWALLAALLAGCAASGPRTLSLDGLSAPERLASIPVERLLPQKNSKKPADISIRKGILALRKGEYKKASKELNKTLRTDPTNSNYQFLNGLAYHLMAENGDANNYEQAQIAYDLALKFDADNWLASEQSGQICLAKKDYAAAGEHFARALLHQPDDPDILYGLAQASYHSQDLQMALATIGRARTLRPDSARISGAHALISAAAGRIADARTQLACYNKVEPNKDRVARLANKVAEWEHLRDAVADNTAGALEQELPSPAAAVPASAGEPPAEEAREEKMVILDVIMIRTEEFQTTNKGVNLLEGLMAQFSGEYTYTKTRENNDSPTTERVLSHRITIPEVNYNLNIFNAADDQNEVLARPTLIALNGKPSTFFAGSTVDVAVTGTQDVDLKTIEAGVTLSVTPTFLPSGRIMMEVTAGRSFFELGAVGTFKESVRTSKNSVTANVVMSPHQTLVLSGLREKQTTETKSGVPLLRDIPLLQYLFSNEKTMDFHKSVVILISPRRPHPGVDGSADPDQVRALRNEPQYLKQYRERYGHMFGQDTNIEHIWGNLYKYKVFNELYKTGTFDRRWWGEAEHLNDVLRRTLSFLYY
ncbi:MAG TPA: hypothetical protein DCS63_06885 [Elusimicrobia bacterium]|nr:hypothetical protein [Elusimicrobiota bacterium]